MNRLLNWWILMAFVTLLQAGEWTQVTPLNTARYGATAVALDGYIYVMGGATTNGIILNSVERYDPATGIWDDISVPNFHDKRLDAAADILNDKIYLISGLAEEGEVEDHIDRYCPIENSWIELNGELNRERRGHVAVSLNNTIVTFGGTGENDAYETRIEYYDEGQDRWFETDDEIVAPRANPYAFATEDIFYMFGGTLNFPTSSSWKATVGTDWSFNWEPGPTLEIARSNGATAVLGDSLYLIGGVNTSNMATDIVEVFSFDSEQLVTGVAIPSPRIGMAAAILNDSIYVIGGYTSNPLQPTTLVEVYANPMTSTISPPAGQIPLEFAQIGGYPNPFNGNITLAVNLPASAVGEIVVFDVRGRKVTTIYRGYMSAGSLQYSWDATDDSGSIVGSGVYFAVLNAERFKHSQKIVYIR